MKSVTLLKGKVASLHLKINDLDLYNRRQNLEINGLLEFVNENCEELVVGVLKRIYPSVTNNGIDLVSRIGKHNFRNGYKKKKTHDD